MSETDAPPRTLVVLCTYDERDNVVWIVPRIREVLPDADVLVVDDDSPDGTGAAADALSAADPHVQVLHRVGCRGLGTATTTALRHALAAGYECVAQLDADGSHDPAVLPALRAALRDCDAAIGSRYVPGGGFAEAGWRRLMLSRTVNRFARLLLGLPVRDCSGSFRCYRAAKLAELDFDRIRASGYGFFEELLYRLRRVGCRFREVPIVYAERRHGKSKIDVGIILGTIRDLLVLGWENLRAGRVRREASPTEDRRSTASGR